MESKKINQLATELTPALDDLTIIGDPTTGISKKITLSQMASLFTGTVEEYASVSAFPLVGVADTIYIALDTNVLYRWDTTLTSYVELSPNIINSLVFNDANGFDGTISLVGSVATLTITTALTQGSVGFIGASGALVQDNANFFWDDTNNRLGIGTNAPTTAIDVFGSGIIGRLNGTSTNNSFLGFASGGTNQWSIGNVQSDQRFRIYSEANTAELVSVLQTGEFGIGIANPTTKLHIDGGASALIANLDANVSVAKSISFRSDNSARINLEVSGIESGSNAGANFFIRRYSDAGALLDTPLTITRSTGAITLTGALSGTSATFSGTLGIGTATSPAAELQVGKSSDVTIALSNSNSVTSGNRGSIAWYNSSVSTVANIKATAVTDNVGTQLEFYTRPAAGSLTQVMTLASTGAATFSSSVTAGSLSRIGDVFIGGRSGTYASYTDGVFGDNLHLGATSTGGAVYINTALSRNLIINPVGGNVGIGTSSPTGTIGAGYTSRLTIYNSANAALNIQDPNGNWFLGTTSGNFVFYSETAATERMRITSGGDVYIGNSTISTANTAIFLQKSGIITSVRAYSSGTIPLIEFYKQGAGDIGSISYNGTNTLYNSTSDYRLKEDLKDYNAIEIIGKLKTYNFKWKDTDVRDYGMMAHELQEVLPNYVSGEKDAIKENGTMKIQGVDYSKIVPVLIKAIQELNAKIK